MKINAIIANTGNGDVTTGNVSIGDIHQENGSKDEHRAEFLEILQEISEEIKSFHDDSVSNVVKTIQEETKRGKRSKKALKFALETLQKTGVTMAAQGLTSLVSKALKLLPLT